MRLYQETEQITVEGLEMLVETTAATFGLLLAAGEHEAVVWLGTQFQEVIHATLKQMGIDLDRGLRVKVGEN